MPSELVVVVHDRAAFGIDGRDFRLRNRRSRGVRYFSGDRRHHLLAVCQLRRHKRYRKQQSRCDSEPDGSD